MYRKSSAFFILSLLVLGIALTHSQTNLTPQASGTMASYNLESSSGLGTQVKGLTGHVFPGGDSESSSAILTSMIKSDMPFNRLSHNGNPTIWGPQDNDVNALPIEFPVEGDLVFAVNFEDAYGSTYSFDRMEVWIPPEFQGITGSAW